MASALVEANTGGRLAPALAEVGRNLHGRSPPTTLAGEDDGAARRHIREVVDFAAFEDRPAQRPIAAPSVRFRNECTFPCADEQEDLHERDHIAVGYQLSVLN